MAGQASGQPNIILILTDDMRADDLAYMPAVQSLLVDQGVTLTNFLTTNPSCAPARASILRGQYAHNHGVMRSKGDVGGIEQFLDDGDEESTVATWLQAAGLRTALVGKYLNGYGLAGAATSIPPGWSDWAGITREGYSRFEINQQGTLVRYRSKSENEVYSTDVLAQLAVDFLADAAQAQDPFFLMITPRSPHGPAEPASRHRDAFSDVTLPQTPAMNEADVSDKPAWIAALPPLTGADQADMAAYHRSRLQTLLSVDELVARVVAKLEESGALANTYILFTSDNGYALGEHRLMQEKGSAYSESSALPMVIRGPGIAAGTTLDVLASQADLAPTFAEWTGASVPGFVDGRSLASILAGSPIPPDWRQAALIEHDESAVNDSGHKPTWAALRGTAFLYTTYNTGEQELYDLRLDPYQIENLAATADSTTLATLADRAQRMRTCQAEACRSIESEPLPPALTPAN
ncbi:MAG: sulfatase [Thermomicrobiales bacterium]|nr:sulfatase [Thermomicrobiales bacterium]MCA9879136.1 sulfatase [Thermomicrobiales bacterium]